MLSSEIADLAGVTVRTLRHYHHVGVLHEPPRSSAGYRHYDISHLVQLLRIKRLTALGVPLADLERALDVPSAAENLLEELDLQAAAEIERLEARRARIATLRRSGSPPDLPPELFAWRTTIDQGLPRDVLRYEHEQLVLLGHLLGDEAKERFADAFETMNERTVAPLTARFYALDEATSEDEIASLIEEMVSHLQPMLTWFDDLPKLDRQVPALMDELNRQRLHPVQHHVLRQVEKQMAQLDEA